MNIFAMGLDDSLPGWNGVLIPSRIILDEAFPGDTHIVSGLMTSLQAATTLQLEMLATVLAEVPDAPTALPNETDVPVNNILHTSSDANSCDNTNTSSVTHDGTIESVPSDGSFTRASGSANEIQDENASRGAGTVGSANYSQFSIHSGYTTATTATTRTMGSSDSDTIPSEENRNDDGIGMEPLASDSTLVDSSGSTTQNAEESASPGTSAVGSASASQVEAADGGNDTVEYIYYCGICRFLKKMMVH
jgi:hypothetical protein